MRIAEVKKLPLGVYRVHWKSGGKSVAAMGMMHDGTRWLAPANWSSIAVSGVCVTDWAGLVYRLELIEQYTYEPAERNDNA